MRHMFMMNSPYCQWQGQSQPFRVNNQSNRQMFMNGPPMPGPYRPPMSYNMVAHYRHGPVWQGPAPSRPRGRGYRVRGGASQQYPDSSRNSENFPDSDHDICCQCGDRLQNSNESGIHLCEGGNPEQVNEDRQSDENEDLNRQANEEQLEAKLEKLLSSLKDFVRSKYETVSDAFEGYVSEKIEQINNLHRENEGEREAVEKIKKEFEEKATALIDQEKELREKLKRLSRDQDAFKREMKKERDEVCRQWQQLRDEITRMEEMHTIQQGRIKLDVGGVVFTTSLLTLTRESDSMLAAMFSGRHEVQREDDGCVFIDRDGTHFRYILNYLRDGGVNMDCLPRDRQLLRELKKEATYYQLHGLLQQIEKCLY